MPWTYKDSINHIETEVKCAAMRLRAKNESSGLAQQTKAR